MVNFLKDLKLLDGPVIQIKYSLYEILGQCYAREVSLKEKKKKKKKLHVFYLMIIFSKNRVVEGPLKIDYCFVLVSKFEVTLSKHQKIEAEAKTIVKVKLGL